MHVCMHVCTKSFLKTTTNSSCVCTHLANKADSDSDSDSDSDKIVHVKSVVQPQFYEATKTHSVSVFDAHSLEYHDVGELTL